MSNIYITEPATEGKVLLHTSFGDLDVELWPQQAPKACRNFVQLCLEGYYDDTIFHRVIAGFMVQGGDPTGTGTGGESVFGGAFVDEFHSRLRFNHRGLLAMANENKPNSNHSQFFFTLDACEFLEKKHTIFGKITGNTIFNLLSVGELETDANDRPLNPPKLLGVEVLWNPFDDVVARDIKHAKASDTSSTAEDALKKKKRERKATKDLKLLSFGDEEEVLDADTTSKKKTKRKKMMSSHDLLDDRKLKAEVDTELLEKIAEAEPIGEASGKKLSTGPKKSAKESLKAAVAAAAAREKGGAVSVDSKSTNGEGQTAAAPEATAPVSQRSDTKKREQDEYKQLREELRKSRKAVPLLMGDKAKREEEARAFDDMLTPLQQQRQKYLQRKKDTSRSSRQQETLLKLKSFQATLADAHTKTGGDGKDDDKSSRGKDEAYHGQVLESDGEKSDAEANDDNSWMTAKLKFKKHIDDQFRAGAAVDDYLTIDPRAQGGHGARDSRSGVESRHRDSSRSDRDRRSERGRDRSRDRSRDRGRDRGRDRDVRSRRH